MFTELFHLYRYYQLQILDMSLFLKVMIIITQGELTVTTVGKDKIVKLYYVLSHYKCQALY